MSGKDVSPKPSKRYAKAKRNGNYIIFTCILQGSVPQTVLSAYHDLVHTFPSMLLHEGIYVTGLFRVQDL